MTLARGPLARNYLRVRGEYNDSVAFVGIAVELPPRARRILILIAPITIIVGTTSACAENTPAGQSQMGKTRNYLRVRGEYWVMVSEINTNLELPPRARRIRR